METGAEVRPEAPVNGVYRAMVTAVQQVTDAASGTFAVELELTGPIKFRGFALHTQVSPCPEPKGSGDGGVGCGRARSPGGQCSVLEGG